MTNGWIDFINLSVGIAGVTMTMLGLLVTLVYRPLDQTIRRYFVLFFSLLIVYTGSILVCQAVDFLLPLPSRSRACFSNRFRPRY